MGVVSTWLIMKSKDEKFGGIITGGYISALGAALFNGEIILKNRKLTREQAIKKLKEAKDLFELDVINEEEYNKERGRLIPLIKEN